MKLRVAREHNELLSKDSNRLLAAIAGEVEIINRNHNPELRREVLDEVLAAAQTWIGVVFPAAHMTTRFTCGRGGSHVWVKLGTVRVMIIIEDQNS